MNIEPSELSPATASVLRRFAARRKRLIWIRALAVGVLSLAVAMSIVILIDYRWLLPTSIRFVVSMVGYGLSFAAMWWISLRFLKRSDQQEIAKQLESVDPRLREDLLSAVELSTDEGANGSPEFRERLQRVVAWRAAGMDVAKLLPLSLLRSWITAASIVAGLAAILLMIPPLQIGRRLARAMLPGLAIERASITQVKIIKPDPATAFVARGDAVGITAEISNLTQLGWDRWATKDGVWLQYHSGDGPVSEIEMAARTLDSASRDVPSRRAEFAANLMMGESPVRYRIIAGDAVTLWNTLTPRSRPHVQSILKDYVYPAYSELPVRTVREEHGDLRALAGTRATVTVEFDEPVSDAVIRVGSRKKQIKLSPVESVESLDGSTTLFKTTISIDAPSQYQVDAVSQSSGLSNPFGRQYAIVPLNDSPPIIRWDDSMARIAVVSPIEVVSLLAEIVDDLPIQRVLQKTSINGKALTAVRIDLESEGRRHNVTVPWDLYSLRPKLAVGDIVQTRLVAIDRRGQMSDSEVLEFLIAEEGFDSHRHDFIDRLHKLTSQIHAWFDQAKTASKSFAAKSQAWKSLDEQTDTLIDELEKSMAIASTTTAIDEPLEQIGRAIIDWRYRTSVLRINNGGRRANDFELNQIIEQLDLIDSQSRSLFSHVFTVALVDDAISLHRSMTPLLDPESEVPPSRLPRYLNMLKTRLNAIESLIDSHASQLQASTLEHLGKWSDWSGRWKTDLRELSEEEIKTNDQARILIDHLSLFDLELQQQTRHSLLDGVLVSSLIRQTREFDRTTGSISQAIVSSSTVDQDEDKEPAAQALTLAKIEGEVSLQQKLTDLDLRYVADLNLVKRAMGDRPAEQIQQKIASAIRLLTAAHGIESCRREIAKLASSEERLTDTASVRIDHPTRLERFAIRLESTIKLLKASGVTGSLIEPIDEARSGDSFSDARGRTSRRRWSEDEVQSAALPLRAVDDLLSAGFVSLKPLFDEARAVLIRYSPTIPELATAAAEEIAAAEDIAAAEGVEQVEDLAKTDDVVEALHDFSNTADQLDREQRVLARDADSATAQIQAAKFQGDMQNLAEILRATAEHFSNAEDGNDLTSSREELRSREQEMGLTESLDKLSKQADSIAEAAGKTPQELLQQLERQLQRNEGMQDELTDIADRAEEAVQRELEKLAEDENNINRSLEASDPDLKELKQRTSKYLQATGQRLSTIQEALLSGAQRSSNWGNLEEVYPDLAKSQAALTETTKLLVERNRETNSMESIRETAKRAAEAVAEIASTMKTVSKNASEATEQNLHQNERARSQQQQSLQRFERNARRQQIIGQQKLEMFWKRESNSARQRGNLSNRLRSEAERQEARLRQANAKSDADTKVPESLATQIELAQALKDRAANAKRALKAAEETERFADQRVDQEAAERRKLERQTIAPLEKPNPAAQLTERMGSLATAELSKVKEQLDAAAADMAASDDLVADPKQAKELSNKQSRVSENVQRAADDLRRIARHQERLGQGSDAARTSDIADHVEKEAKVASENAESDLRNAAESPENSPQANRQVATAGRAIRDVSQRLTANLKSDEKGETEGDEPKQKARQSDRQLAQTLDELDRSISQSKNSSATQGEGEQPSSSQTPSSAGEASPTLSSALRSIVQNAARSRQRSTEPNEQPSSEKSQSSEGSPSGDLGTDSSTVGEPSGNPPGGPSVPIDDVDRKGSQWGQLRRRADENNGQAQRGLVPNQYRKEIEAYFRVIARQQGGNR